MNEMISSANNNADTIAQTLKDATNSVGATLSTNKDNIWTSNTGLNFIVKQYGDNFIAGLTNVSNTLNSINDLVNGMVSA